MANLSQFSGHTMKDYLNVAQFISRMIIKMPATFTDVPPSARSRGIATESPRNRFHSLLQIHIFQLPSSVGPPCYTWVLGGILLRNPFQSLSLNHP